jgi:hypothetical protein
MTTCGQKYWYNDSSYCRNDNDNKIVQHPIFRMTMIIVVMILMTRVVTMRIENHNSSCCCASHMLNKLLIQHIQLTR